uniref:Uncharacterized protein n=1 Tax=Parascaris univalens TaxID=6257 RepID=A0A914ZZM9_PARUN
MQKRVICGQVYTLIALPYGVLEQDGNQRKRSMRGATLLRNHGFALFSITWAPF